MALTQLRNLGIIANAGIATTKLGTGAVLQVVNTANATTYSTSSTTFQDAFSASITPSSTSNKILVIAHNGATDSDTAANFIAVTLFRDSTDLGGGVTFMTATRNESANANGNMIITELDSPNTTSSVTYTIKFKKSSGTGTVWLNNSGRNRITLMEIKG